MLIKTVNVESENIIMRFKFDYNYENVCYEWLDNAWYIKAFDLLNFLFHNCTVFLII